MAKSDEMYPRRERTGMKRRAFLGTILRTGAAAGLGLHAQAGCSAEGPPWKVGLVRAPGKGRPSKRLRAGAAASKITPAKGVRLDGTIMRIGPVKEVHDDLYARALVLDDGRMRVTIVVCDATFIEQVVLDEAKELIRKQAGLPASRVLASATHSHMAVRALASIAGDHPPNRKYHKFLARQIAEAVVRAVKNLAPAQIGWGVAPKREFCHNRRWIMKPGTIGPNPFGQRIDKVKMGGRPAKDRVKPAGPIDPDLSILSVQHADGRPLALLANYSVHYSGMVRGQVSADYFGAFAARVEELLGRDDGREPVVAIMSNGTSGDIGAARTDGGKFEGMRKVGHIVADTAMTVYAKIQHRDRVPLAMAESRITLGVRRPDKKRIEWAKLVQGGKWNKPAHHWRDVYAHNTLELSKYPQTVSVKLQAIRVGELGIAACPCETFAETGLAIKKHSPLKPTFTIELANGFGGYLPPPAQHALGGYTTWPAESSYLEVQAEPKIRAALLALLTQVAADRPQEDTR